MSTTEGGEEHVAVPGFVGHDKGLGFYGKSKESCEGCSEEKRFSRYAFF